MNEQAERGVRAAHTQQMHLEGGLRHLHAVLLPHHIPAPLPPKQRRLKRLPRVLLPTPATAGRQGGRRGDPLREEAVEEKEVAADHGEAALVLVGVTDEVREQRRRVRRGAVCGVLMGLE